MEQINKCICKIICIPIHIYQRVSRLLNKPCCRFHPSCSDYALLSIERHGVFKGLWLTGCRLMRCHPWSDAGYDPVPNKEKF